MSQGWIRRLWPYLMAHRADVIAAFGETLAGLAVSAFLPVTIPYLRGQKGQHD